MVLNTPHRVFSRYCLFRLLAALSSFLRNTQLRFKPDLGAEVHSTVPTLPYSPRVQLPCFDLLINKQIMKKLEGTEQTPVGTCLIMDREKSLSKAASSAFMSSESAPCLGEAGDLF